MSVGGRDMTFVGQHLLTAPSPGIKPQAMERDAGPGPNGLRALTAASAAAGRCTCPVESM
jgi:hypothetical protein